jgi:hypothetical protein
MIMRRNTIVFFILTLYTPFFLNSCKPKSSEAEMLQVLQDTKARLYDHNNNFNPYAKIDFIDSVIAIHSVKGGGNLLAELYYKATVLMELGKSAEASDILKKVASNTDLPVDIMMENWNDLALSYLRTGEQTNCVMNHSIESCVFPIRGSGLHKNFTGSTQAIEIYKNYLQKNPGSYDSRWLLNIAYMTLGKYPQEVPKEWLIPGLGQDTIPGFKAFEDIAPQVGLGINNMAGGVIIEDFDNDGFLDIVTSGWGLEEPMHFFKNTGEGAFKDISEQSRLSKFTGGLNIQQTDYNNDGFKDIFVLRGAWHTLGFGNQPNSLLRNNGDGTFTDVTIEAGLLSFHPTQAASWNDYNNDGWLDVFIGNESNLGREKEMHPCELYINNKNGTFTNVAAAAKVNLELYVKGVTSGDYDKDGWQDLFLSTMSGKRVLLHNTMGKTGNVGFENTSHAAGIDLDTNRSFPTWFWDYDNDGWLDIFVCDYTFKEPLSYFAAADALGKPFAHTGEPCLYRNNRNGTFTNITKESGLFKTAYAMGANFGDIDNDGWLDFYLGTGNPDYRSLVPNKMFRSLGGKGFQDVTTSAKVGSLQKGHGVGFGDMDNDGDQDIYIEMGGAYIGDAYTSSFFLNPERNKNNWIDLSLEGTVSNKAAIGSQVKVTVTENGVKRSIYRDVNSGGSFGSSTLRREIGIGSATKIDEIEIKWHGSGKVQRFTNVPCNQFLKITEGKDELAKANAKKVKFQYNPADVISCPPGMSIVSIKK